MLRMLGLGFVIEGGRKPTSVEPSLDGRKRKGVIESYNSFLPFTAGGSVVL